jgi:hypothetical protein
VPHRLQGCLPFLKAPSLWHGITLEVRFKMAVYFESDTRNVGDDRLTEAGSVRCTVWKNASASRLRRIMLPPMISI